MDIRDPTPADELAMADLLVAAFAEDWPTAFPDREKALESVRQVVSDGFARVAMVDGAMAGWIGGLSEYDGLVWELHPLAVAPSRQGTGVGSALVRDLEARVAERGGLTIILGTDDENDLTSIAGVDLYDDLLGRLATITARRRHPFVFYQKLGYVVSGVIPDANGPGKPDILMSKRVRRGV